MLVAAIERKVGSPPRLQRKKRRGSMMAPEEVFRRRSHPVKGLGLTRGTGAGVSQPGGYVTAGKSHLHRPKRASLRLSFSLFVTAKAFVRALKKRQAVIR